MNWDMIEGNWKQFEGYVKAKWGRLTDENLNLVAGKRERFSAKLQETYEIGRAHV